MQVQEYKKIMIDKDQIVPVAERMRKKEIWLTMIHGFVNKEGQMEICYDYQVEPVIESYHVVGEMTVPSIGEIYDVAAQWPEREINELMLETQGKGQIMVTPLSELRRLNREEAEET